MSDFCTDALAALDFVEAAMSGDASGAAHLIAETDPVDLRNGLASLAGSLLRTSASSNGVSTEDMVEVLRAQFLIADKLGRFVSMHGTETYL